MYVTEYGTKVHKLTANKELKLRQAINCLCYNIVYSLSFGKNKVGITLDENAFSLPLIYNGTKVNRRVSYTYTRSVIDWLQHTGRILLHKGKVEDWFLDKDGVFKPSKVSSSYIMVSEWLELLFSDAVDRKKLPTLSSVLVVRDSAGKSIPKRLGDYERAIVDTLNTYNHIARQTTIGVNLDIYDVQLRKVYNNSSFDEGGRNYISNTVNFKKEERPLIKIDGELTTELDFKALHPRLAATIEGVELDEDFDPYQIELEGYSKELSRYLGKWGTLILLNSGVEYTQKGKMSVNASRLALITALRSRPEVNFDNREVELKGVIHRLPDFADYTDILLKCLERNDYIRVWFHEPRGLTLQNLDSKIMDLIISKFNELDEIVIPVHDSIVLKEHLADKGREIMRGCFKQVMGNDFNCIIV